MINPNDIIKFDRTTSELEELILFLVCVAGKKAATVSEQLDKMFPEMIMLKPFFIIRCADASGELLNELKRIRIGQYTRIEKAFRELAYSNINLRECSLEDLMEIHGIGRKSASCFLAWTRKDVRVAMLDTHLLKWIKADYEESLTRDNLTEEEWLTRDLLNGVTIPKSTPSSKGTYNLLEDYYLERCDFLGVNPTEYDLEIWRSYST